MNVTARQMARARATVTRERRRVKNAMRFVFWAIWSYTKAEYGEEYCSSFLGV